MGPSGSFETLQMTAAREKVSELFPSPAVAWKTEVDCSNGFV